MKAHIFLIITPKFQIQTHYIFAINRIVILWEFTD